MSFNDPGGFATGDAALGLRPLSWDGLCARIAAAQDLRRTLSAICMGSAIGTGPAALPSGHAAPASGSFHRQAAMFIASGIPGVPPQTGVGEHIVNPNSSANGKANAGTLEGLNTGVRPDRAEA